MHHILFNLYYIENEEIEKTLYRHYTDLFTSERVASFLNDFFSNNLIRSLMSEVEPPVDPLNESVSILIYLSIHLYLFKLI
jgi:hypothetical protein